MRIDTTENLDDLREELAELRAELKRAMRAAKPRSGGAVGRVGDRLTHQVAQMATAWATNFAADFVVKRGRLLRRPVEQAIASHPFGAAALALTAVVIFGRYIVRSPLD
jgi:hypothetical protein